jgi:hypothetical protein
VALLDDGGLVVVWQSSLQDGSSWGIFAQRYDAAGRRKGAEFRVNTTVAAAQFEPVVAAFPSGGFIVVWTSDQLAASGPDIFAQLYNAAGAKIGREFKVNVTAAGAQTKPAVAVLANDAFVVTWTASGQDLSGLGVYGRLYRAAGVPAGPEFRVNVSTRGAQSEPSVSALTDGGYVVAWSSDPQDGSGSAVYARLYNHLGRPTGNEFRIDPIVRGVQTRPSAAGLADGGFAVAFESTSVVLKVPTPTVSIYAQRFTSAGIRAGASARVNTTAVNIASPLAIAALPEGYVVLWSANARGIGGFDVYGQVFDALGRRVDAEIPVNTTTDQDQWLPAVAPLAVNRFFATWTSTDQDGSLQGVYGQRFGVASSSSARASPPSQ